MRSRKDDASAAPWAFGHCYEPKGSSISAGPAQALVAQALLPVLCIFSRGKIQGCFTAIKMGGKERAPQAPWSAATWRRLQRVPSPVPGRRRAAALQGASRIFAHCGGPTAHDIFAQDDGFDFFTPSEAWSGLPVLPGLPSTSGTGKNTCVWSLAIQRMAKMAMARASGP